MLRIAASILQKGIHTQPVKESGDGALAFSREGKCKVRARLAGCPGGATLSLGKAWGLLWH